MMTKIVEMCSYICNLNKREVEILILGCHAVSHPRRTDTYQHCCRNLKTRLNRSWWKMHHVWPKLIVKIMSITTYVYKEVTCISKTPLSRIPFIIAKWRKINKPSSLKFYFSSLVATWLSPLVHLFYIKTEQDTPKPQTAVYTTHFCDKSAYFMNPL
jgi:hypothetical protein